MMVVLWVLGILITGHALAIGERHPLCGVIFALFGPNLYLLGWCLPLVISDFLNSPACVVH